MVGGGIAAAMLALQMASKAYGEESSTPSYTVPEPLYPRASETASINCCMTSMPCDYSTGSLR